MFTSYICTLPFEVQQDIADVLVMSGILGDDLERAMNGRVCDLEDTIDVERWR